MPERSTISQAVQIGVEATPGTAVAATRRLGSIGVEVGAQADISAQRPNGQKYANLQVLGREWSEASLSGAPAYTELPYLFSSLLSTPTVTPVVGAGNTATGAHLWTFDTNSFGADAPKTYTIEQGDASRAHRVTYGLLQALTMGWSRNEVSLDGTMLSRRLEDGITMTPGGAMLPQVPVRPSELSVYLDSTSGDLGTTKLTRAISGEWAVGSRFTPVWVVDAALPSFAAHVESEPEASFTLMQQADAQGMANLVAMRGGTTRFARLEAVGPIIAGTGDTAVRHRMTLDMAGQVSDVSPFSDEDGVYAVEWTFGAVHDPTWTRAMRVQVTTTTAAL
jgi:hypothetical protein